MLFSLITLIKELEKSSGENCERFKATSISKLSGRQYSLNHPIAVFPKHYYFGVGFFPIELMVLLGICLQDEG